MENVLASKIESRSATTCVLGLGYVGLPLAIEMVKAGLNVIGLIQTGKVEALRCGNPMFMMWQIPAGGCSRYRKIHSNS